jgi:hypothetical protein
MVEHAPRGAVLVCTPIGRKVRVRAKLPRWMENRTDRRVPGGKKRFRGALLRTNTPLT